MNRKLFISGLPTHMRNNDLTLMISQYAEISNIRIDYNPESGEALSQIMVSVESDEAASQIYDSLNGITIEGKKIKVAKIGISEE
jgi:RNA recognition motif-containing protein